MLEAAKLESRSIGAGTQELPALETATAVRQVIDCLADSSCPILIVGEQGSGKRTVAQWIHKASSQSQKEFLEINCRTATDQSVGTAVKTPGTLYLAEIADLPLTAQASLMEYFRLNGSQPMCRILAATSRNLQQETRSRCMREDLFYAIGSVSIQTVPLRYRKDEVVEAADKFLDVYATMFGRPKPILSDEMVSFMLDHDWPGNFRELETAAKTLVALADESIAMAAFRALAAKSKANGGHGQLSLKQASRAASLQAERELISEVLVSTGWNRKQAARELRISYKALLYKIRQNGMENAPMGRRNGHMQ